MDAQIAQQPIATPPVARAAQLLRERASREVRFFICSVFGASFSVTPLPMNGAPGLRITACERFGPI
jgi:hypothetical protein